MGSHRRQYEGAAREPSGMDQETCQTKWRQTFEIHARSTPQTRRHETKYVTSVSIGSAGGVNFSRPLKYTVK